MILDRLDQAFVQRCCEDSALSVSVAISASESPCIAVIQAVTESREESPAAIALAVDAPADPEGILLERLLLESPCEWQAIATCVDAAYTDGCRVFAVVGTQPCEGRTMLVQGIARTLQSRGHRVVRVKRVSDAMHIESSDREYDSSESVVIVDAGVWFTRGPVRRQVLQQKSLGCDAVLLVRRADRTCCKVYGEAIEAIGLKLLGEVLTFAPATLVE